MEGKRKSGEVEIEKCFHFFGGGQFSLKRRGKDDNREICPLFTFWWSDFAD